MLDDGRIEARSPAGGASFFVKYLDNLAALFIILIGMGQYEIFSTETFDTWIDGLKDINVRTIILKYVDRMADGNLGDVLPVGGGVMERKIDVGPGYRLYFTKVENTVLLLLCGGDKSTQQRDITRAKRLKQEAMP